MTSKLKIFTFLALILTLVVAGCSPQANDASNDEEGETDELVVYSARKEQFVKPLVDKFEEESGVKVKLMAADEALVNKILEEKNNPQADIFFSNDTGALEYLRIEDALAPNDSDKIQVIDEKYRADDGSWVGLSARSRIFMYNKDLTSEKDLPQTLWDLTDSKYKGKFAITRGGNGSMVAHVAALRAEWGDEKTKEWIEKVKENAAIITEGHGDIRQAVGAGEVEFGLVNNYYFHQQLDEPKDNNVDAVYPDQGKDDMGIFVNAAGVGLIKGGPNQANAKKFIDFLTEDEQQKIFSFESKEIPLVEGIETTSEAKPLSEYKVMDMPLKEIGPVWLDAKKLIEEAGLDLEVK
ncbi:extracellular solute-binding protein [Desmospora profundinema]|uniref:Iron(III) transport system substrate-binding protein n=1 Tax=Desmospora profundinema TaxID=1571184 RepID=A0ABU1IKH3_9BACL|nr:extracellular solute-binding protein [Desmospora profundinema]MDR6225287.1 iron(III) transport system substrate-binding protein [Desmospora profundinema]